MAKHSDTLLDCAAALFKAMGDAKRLKILDLLMGGPKSVGEIVGLTGCLQANVSKHLKTLSQAGLVESKKQGTSVYYSISDPCVAQICDIVCKSSRKIAHNSLKRLRNL